jgi:hypothetical protein
VADQVGDTLTISAGNNISYTSVTGTDTFTIAVADAPTFTGNVTAGNLVTSGTVTLDRLSLSSSQTTVSPLQLTASSLNDGVGALRIDGAQADIFLNPDTATHTTVTFAVNDDQRLAFGMDSNSDFYITRRTGGTWYDDTLVIDRASGDVALGYTLTATGNVTGGNLITSALVSAATVTATGNITGGNLITSALVSAATVTASGTITYGTLNDGTTDLTATVAELNYVDGVTSSIQTQLDAKAGNAFKTLSVSGQSDIVADSATDTLTFSAGSGITITTNASTDTMTITAASASFPFAQEGDFASVTDSATTTEDLGDLDSTNATTYDLGTIISAEGLIYPGQLILPQYDTASLPTPTVEAQLAYDTDTNSVKFTNGTEWTGYVGTSSPTFTGTAAFASLTASGTAVVTGNVTGGNLITGGLVSVTGNVTGGNLVTGGLVSATGNVNAADALFTGTMTAGTIVETSTIRIKENVEPIVGGLDAILNLTGVTYDRKDTRAHEAGLIAEQVNEILPDLVAKDLEGNPSAIQYTKLTAYLVEAVKSLKAEIDELKRKH